MQLAMLAERAGARAAKLQIFWPYGQANAGVYRAMSVARSALSGTLVPANFFEASRARWGT